MGRSQIHEVYLTDEERNTLSNALKSGSLPVKEVKRIQILLNSDRNGPAMEDWEIADLLAVTITTVHRLRVKFCKEGIAIIKHKKGAGRPRIIDGDIEAQMIAIACSSPPSGKVRWTLRMIADKVVVLSELDSISHQSVKTTLKKTNLSLG